MKAHAWKACIPQGIVGSNPTLSARLRPRFARGYVWFNYYMKQRYYVYILKSEKTGDIYTGYTVDLNNRIKQHNEDMSKYTKGKGPWGLVWFAAFDNKEKALSFEKYLKQGSGYAFARKRFI